MQHKSHNYKIKNAQRDEAYDFLTAMQPDAITPDSVFLQDLEARLISRATAEPSPTLFSYILSFMKNPNKYMAVGAAVMLTAAVAVGAGTWSFYSSQNNTLKALPNSEAILQEIVAAGAQKPSTGAPTGKLAASDSRIASTMLVAPRRLGYYYDAATYVYGPKADVCGNSRAYKIPSYTTEYYEFNGAKSEETYSKSIITDNQGKLLDYRLTTPTGNYLYKGGSFAVKMINEPKFNILAAESLRSGAAATDKTTESSSKTLPADEPAQEPKAPSIKDYFGDNAKVIGEEIIDGALNYVVVWEYENFCSETEKMQMVNKTWMKKDGFRYTKQEMYVSSIKPENLIAGTTYKYDQGTPAFSEVSSKFDFAYKNVNLRTVDAQEYVTGSAKYNAALSKFLKEKGVTLLKPVDTKYAVQLFTSDILGLPTAEAYLKERDFFRNDAIGEQDYKQTKDIYSYQQDLSIMPLANLAFERGGKNWRNLLVNSFKGLDAATIEKNILNQDLVKSDIKITIDSQSVDARAYTYKAEKGTKPCPDCATDWTVVFTLNGEFMVVRFTAKATAAELPAMLQFITLTSANNQSEINQMIKVAGDKYAGPEIAY
jgi:hypothetical protein